MVIYNLHKQILHLYIQCIYGSNPEHDNYAFVKTKLYYVTRIWKTDQDVTKEINTIPYLSSCNFNKHM